MGTRHSPATAVFIIIAVKNTILFLGREWEKGESVKRCSTSQFNSVAGTATICFYGGGGRGGGSSGLRRRAYVSVSGRRRRTFARKTAEIRRRDGFLSFCFSFLVLFYVLFPLFFLPFVRVRFCAGCCNICSLVGVPFRRPKDWSSRWPVTSANISLIIIYKEEEEEAMWESFPEPEESSRIRLSNREIQLYFTTD